MQHNQHHYGNHQSQQNYGGHHYGHHHQRHAGYQQAQYQQPSAGASSGGKVVIGVVAMLVLGIMGVVGLGVLMGMNPDYQRAQAAEAAKEQKAKRAEAERLRRDAEYGTSVDAYTYAQAVVKASLKAPDTADFPMIHTDKACSRSGKVWTCKNSVTAKNSFGVPIRNHWKAEMMWQGKGTWKLQDFELNE